MLWLILGLVIGCVLYFLISGVRKGNLKITWYQWVLGAISVSMLLFTVQNYLGFQQELESNAGNFILMTVGLPAIILAALIWVIPLIINKSKGQKSNKGLTD